MNSSPSSLVAFDVCELERVDAVMRSSVDELHQQLAEHGLVVFRQQSVGDHDMVALLQRLGRVTFTQGEKAVANCRDLNVVSNVGKRNSKSVFHSDTSYVRDTPAYTMLRPIELPQRGGATLFTNQYFAWKRLPAAIRERLDAHEALHVVTGLDETKLDETRAWHPLARRHPRSGKTALFLTTPKRCRRLRDANGEVTTNSDKIIGLLYRHSIRRCPVYRHQWQAGDLVIWDNRCTMHRGDHEGVVGHRVFHRGMAIDIG